MTTIAANREMMAGDSQVSCGGGGLKFSTQKIWRIGSSIYGIAGGMFGEVFLEWASNDFKPKAKPNLYPVWDSADFEILELAPDGLAWWEKHLVRVRLKEDNYAIGAGAAVAMVLMRECGMSPDQAVLKTAEYDEYTSPPVDVLYLKETQLIVPKPKRKVIKDEGSNNNPSE